MHSLLLLQPQVGLPLPCFQPASPVALFRDRRSPGTHPDSLVHKAWDILTPPTPGS